MTMRQIRLRAVGLVLIACILVSACQVRRTEPVNLSLAEFFSSDANAYLDVLSEEMSAAAQSHSIDSQDRSEPVANPVGLCIEGLRAVLNGDLSSAKKTADLLLGQAHKDKRSGAMFFRFEYDLNDNWPYGIQAPWPSALAQGLALELFTHLYKLTGHVSYRQAADSIYASYLLPIEQGGFTRFDAHGPFFEEHPTILPSRILRGAAIAMLALYDYSHVCGNSKAFGLFKKSVTRLESLIEKYSIVDPLSRIVCSAHSLAAPGHTVVGRFVGSGDILVTEMRLLLLSAGEKAPNASVNIGSVEDEDESQPISVWQDSTYMNWGPRTIVGDSLGRPVNANKGVYNHSPFRLNLPMDYARYALEIDWLVLTPGTMDVQLYDESEYWRLGSLQAMEESKSATVRFEIPSQFINSWVANLKFEPQIDKRYQDDNQMLIDLLANVTGSESLKKMSQEWSLSKQLVPQPHMIRPPLEVLEEDPAGPVLGVVDTDMESHHVEYPSVVRSNDMYVMFYSAYGRDGSWKLLQAVSNDSINWKRHGQMLSPSTRAAQKIANAAFPHVIQLGAPRMGYVVYFSVAETVGAAYTRIDWAYSDDALNWSYGGTAIREPGHDPIVIRHGTDYVMFFTTVDNGISQIKRSVSEDGVRWSKPVLALASDSSLRGFYTLGSFELDDRMWLLVESQFSRRHEVLLYLIKPDGSLLGNTLDPLIVDKDWVNSWNAIRYGYFVLHEADQYYVFYNGIPHLGDEQNGQIGRARFNVDNLRAHTGIIMQRKAGR